MLPPPPQHAAWTLPAGAASLPAHAAAPECQSCVDSAGGADEPALAEPAEPVGPGWPALLLLERVDHCSEPMRPVCIRVRQEYNFAAVRNTTATVAHHS